MLGMSHQYDVDFQASGQIIKPRKIAATPAAKNIQHNICTVRVCEIVRDDSLVYHHGAEPLVLGGHNSGIRESHWHSIADFIVNGGNMPVPEL
jgi:hypothetical protein